MKKILILLCFFFASPIFGQNPFWVQTNGPSAGSSYMAFNSKGDIFDYNRYLIRSTDGGATWKDITPGFLVSGGMNDWIITQDILYIYTSNDSLYRSTNNGNTWIPVYYSVGGYSLGSSPNGALFLMQAGTPGKPSILLRSLDSGITWKDLSSNVPAITAQDAFFSITLKGELFLQEDQTPYLYYSSDEGNSWNKQSTLPYRMQTQIQGTANGYLFATAIYDSVTDVSNKFLVRSTDNGKTWDSIQHSSQLIIAAHDIIGFPSSNTYDFIFSENYGITWKINPLPAIFQINNQTQYPDPYGNLYWSTEDITIRYNIDSGVYKEVSIPIGNVDRLLADTPGDIIALGNAFFSVSKNRGSTWLTNFADEGVVTPNAKIAAFDSTRSIIVLSNQGLWRSSDLGSSWESTVLPTQTNGWKQILTAPNGNIFILGVSVIIYSTNNGITWQNGTAPSFIPYPAMNVDPSGTLYSFTNQTSLHSIDSSNSWQDVIDITTLIPGTTSQITSLVTTIKDEIYIGTSKDGIIRSTDLGAHWQVANEGLGSANITSLFAAPNGDVYAFCKSGYLPDGIIYRPYNGSRWYSANSGLLHTDNLNTMAFATDGTVYLGTRGEGVWRSQGTIDAVSKQVENTSALSVSPNPATNRITISYSLPESEYINLGIYDALGRIVTPIINGVQTGTAHSQDIDVHGIPNGLYFVRLSVPSGSCIEKIIIAK